MSELRESKIGKRNVHAGVAKINENFLLLENYGRPFVMSAVPILYGPMSQ